MQSNIDGDADTLRIERSRRAFNEKCPKLAAWAGEGRKSVLVLESDDNQHASYSVSYDAVKQILAERSDQPDIIVYVETDAYPWSAWVYKDGERIGNAAMPNSRRWVIAMKVDGFAEVTAAEALDAANDSER